MSKLVIVLIVLGAAGVAEAKQVKFVGVHPIAVGVGGGFCYIEVPHVHVYAPDNSAVLYRTHDGHHYFVGDPVAHGYDGPKHAYYGTHPVPVDVILEEEELDGDEVEYCYLDGPHYHYYLPPPAVKFKMKGGVYWYVGEFPAEYERGRPKYAKINVVYKPIKYSRPVVIVAPPDEYHGAIIDVVEVETHVPVVEVHVPAPTLEFRFGFGVGVGHHHDHDDDHKHKYKYKKHKKHKKGRW